MNQAEGDLFEKHRSSVPQSDNDTDSCSLLTTDILEKHFQERQSTHASDSVDSETTLCNEKVMQAGNSSDFDFQRSHISQDIPADSPIHIMGMRSESAYRVKCVVGGSLVEAVVDTAADVTIMSEETAAKLSIPPQTVSEIKLQTAAEGKPFLAKKVGPISIELGNFSFSTYIFVGPLGDTMLLGLDVLKFLSAIVDIGKKELRWPGLLSESHSLPLFCDKGRDMDDDSVFGTKGSLTCNSESSKSSSPKISRIKSTEVYLCRRVNVPPKSSIVARVKLSESHQSQFMWFEPKSKLGGMVTMANSVHKQSLTPSLNFVNPGDTSVNVKKHTFLGVMHSLDRDEISDSEMETTPADGKLYDQFSSKVQQTIEATSELPENLIDLWKDGCENLPSEEDQMKLKNLLSEYRDVFATSEFDLGNFTAVKHSIDTGDADPVALPLRRCPIHFAEEEKAHLDKMLDAGVISPSNSEWAAAPVLIRKKDKKIRWCLDFRRLNAVTKNAVSSSKNE